MEELTLKQKRVFDFIRERVRESLPPTIREIAREMGFSSTGTVRDYLRALEKKGYLKRMGNIARAIELSAGKAFRIPIVGTITAGGPNLAYEDIQGYVDPDDLFLGRLSQDDVFALRVKGDSMSGAGIMEGDIAIVKQQKIASNGDVVAAMLDDTHEVTLKRLRHKGHNYFLEPANDLYPPIFKEFTILGKVITILRKY